MADGYITIQTKLATDKFDKQVANLEKKIRNEEEKTQLKLKAKLQAENELKRHKQAILEIEKEYEKTSQQVERLQNIMKRQGEGIALTPQDFTDLQNYEQISKENEKIGNTLDKMYAKEEKLNNAVSRTSLAYKQMQDNVQGYKAKIENIKVQKHQEQINQINKGIDKLENSAGLVAKKIGRLALGIFSVASAYRLVSQASSTLGQYDEQYATNLEYIRYLIAQTIAPALKYVVNLASTLLSYLNYILNAWFEITLFSKNSAKNFAKAQGSTSKIKKDLQTTPFDEMNVLSDTSTGGAGGTTMPSIDPTLIAGDIPDWLQFIVDHKDEILGVIAGIASGLLAWENGLKAIKSLGIGVMLTGIIYSIENLLEYLKDPSWQNFGKIIQGIGVAIIGLGILIGQVPIIVIGAIVLIVGTIIKYWEQIKSFLQKGIDWLKSKSDWVYKMFGNNIGNIYNTFVENLQLILNFFDRTFTRSKYMFDQFVEFIKNIFAGKWREAWNNIKNIFSANFEQIKDKFLTIMNIIWNSVKIFASTVGNVIANTFKAVVNGVLRAIENILNSPIRSINRLIEVVNSIPGINMKKLQTFSLPRLKVGGIINMPGRGIPIGGGTAIGGEAGREGVIPLTDSQAMETLGEAIGRYITINANIPISMNGRVLSRQIQQITNEGNFATNK